MAKKRKWLKNTPWRRALGYIHSNRNNNPCVGKVNESEMLFGLFVWIGMPRTFAYRLAFPESKADDASVVQLASRLMQSWKMWRFFSELADKESTMVFRYTKDTEDIKHPY